MSKKVVRLYPQDIERMPWEPAEGGGAERVVATDGKGSVTRYWKLEPGDVVTAEDDRWDEMYVLEGSLTVAGRRYDAGSYLCIPPGVERGEVRSEDGAVVLQALDHHDRLAKPEVRLTADEVEALEWREAESGQTGFKEKFLARDEEHGSLTRLLRVELGGDTTEVDDHDHDEEVLIIEGSCRNGEELHPAGTYTFNPPHEIHGPFVIYEPLLCYEIKNAPRSEDL